MSSSSSEKNSEKIYIHKAKYTIDSNAFIFKPTILDNLHINDVVRISYELIYKSDSWRHDSPFIEIIKFNKDEMLGQIKNINRLLDNKYPLNIGDSIWFKKENVIEIKTTSLEISKFLTNERVMTTGPLYTIQSDSDSSSSSDSEFETESSASDSN